jgi:sugar phosphate isomerase/epimerase
MFQPGVVSITFRKLTVEQIIELTKSSGLQYIEWGGDLHVPHGDIERARRVGDLTRSAGFEISAYGSYYKVGHSESEGLSFQAVLDSAVAIKAQVIRVWAGAKEDQQADDAYRSIIASESRRIAGMAADKDIKVAFEYHMGTLTNTGQSCRDLLEVIDHPNVFVFWQPIYGIGPAGNCEQMQRVKPWIIAVHVFHWWPTSESRCLLEEGAKNWKRYFDELLEIGQSRDLPVMLEFVKDELEDNFRKDATTLIKMLANHQNEAL